MMTLRIRTAACQSPSRSAYPENFQEDCRHQSFISPGNLRPSLHTLSTNTFTSRTVRLHSKCVDSLLEGNQYSSRVERSGARCLRSIVTSFSSTRRISPRSTCATVVAASFPKEMWMTLPLRSKTSACLNS